VAERFNRLTRDGQPYQWTILRVERRRARDSPPYLSLTAVGVE